MDLTASIFYHLAKFYGDRSKDLGDFAPKCKKSNWPSLQTVRMKVAGSE